MPLTLPIDPNQEDNLETEFRLPGDTLAERTYLTQLDQPARFIASPSILALPSGRLLVLYEKCVPARQPMRGALLGCRVPCISGGHQPASAIAVTD